MIRELSKEFRMFQLIPSLTLGLIDGKVLTCDLAIDTNRGKTEHFMARAFSVALNHWEGAPWKRLVFSCRLNAHFNKLC